MRLPWSTAVVACTTAAAAASIDAGSRHSARSNPVAARQAASTNNIAVDTFIRRFHPTAVKLGDYLYVDGGSVASLVNGSSSVRAMNTTVSIPLTQSWTNTTLRMQEIDRTLLPNVNLPVLWADETSNTIYSYGGDSIGTNSSYAKSKQLFKFSPSSSSTDAAAAGSVGTWSTAQPADAFTFSQLYTPSRSASTACNGIGYSLGGYGTGNTDDRFAGGDNNLPLPGLVTYNFATRAWSNSSIADAFSGPSTPGGIRGYFPTNGAAVCLPDLGEAGVLMFLGGTGISANGRASVPVPLDDVLLYDVARRKWSWQGTQGGDGGDGIPPDRRDACAALVKGKKSGTYELFLFGGRYASDVTNQAHGDMWVLTMPGFKWFKASAAQLDKGRAFLSCAAVGKQLVVVGGVSEQSNKQWSVAQTDPWPQGVGVFDLTDMRWRGDFAPDAGDYESPAAVQDWYREGGVAKWDDVELQKLFATEQNPSPTPGSAADPSSNTSGLSSGTTIAIAVAIPVVVLALLGVLVWFCLRRRRRNREAEKPSELHDPNGYLDPNDPAVPPSTYLSEAGSPDRGGSVSPWNKSELAATADGRTDHGHQQENGFYQPNQQQQYAAELEDRRPWAELPSQDPRLAPYEVSGTSVAPGGAR